MIKKGDFTYSLLCFFVVFIIFAAGRVSAEEIDFEIAKLTSYAEEYESGNINYVQLVIYLSSTREKMNEIMGVIDRKDGGTVKEEQLRDILGKETEKTKW